MAKTEVSLRVGGAAGDGVASAAELFARCCSRRGLHVQSYNNYQSVIRGGHSSLHVRASEKPIYCQGDNLDIVIALNKQTVDVHSRYITKGGGVIYDSDKVQATLPDGINDFSMPLNKMALEIGKDPIMQNTIAIGAAIRLFNLDFSALEENLKMLFKKKGDEIVNVNIIAAKAGYDYAESHFKPIDVKLKLEDKKMPFVRGNEAIGFGALAAGCKFYCAYPMTPASSLLHYLVSRSVKYDILVKQMEDEIAVINMTIGASHAGVRAMCGTSGGGFALMTEAVGLASITETPIVIMESQRGGPSTGLPTKTEQGDLNQMMGASQGDFPRIIISPRNVEECFYTTIEAFNLAEKYQLPVIIAMDLHLSENFVTVEEFKHNVKIERGPIAVHKEGEKFLRYKFTDNGVSPRAFPGMKGLAYAAGSDEHDEDGKLISDVLAGIPEFTVVRRKMMEKRMKKLDYALKEMKPPEIVGDRNAEITIVGWGSTEGVIREAVELLAKEGVKANYLQIKYISPFHGKEVTEILKNTKNKMIVEGNYSGQMARHIRAETGIEFENKLLKYDGEPIYPSEIVKSAKDALSSKKSTKRGWF